MVVVEEIEDKGLQVRCHVKQGQTHIEDEEHDYFHLGKFEWVTRACSQRFTGCGVNSSFAHYAQTRAACIQLAEPIVGGLKTSLVDRFLRRTLLWTHRPTPFLLQRLTKICFLVRYILFECECYRLC